MQNLKAVHLKDEVHNPREVEVTVLLTSSGETCKILPAFRVVTSKNSIIETAVTRNNVVEALVRVGVTVLIYAPRIWVSQQLAETEIIDTRTIPEADCSSITGCLVLSRGLLRTKERDSKIHVSKLKA